GLADPPAWHVRLGVLPSGEGYDLGTVVSMSHVAGRGWVAYTKRDDITGSVLERLNAWHAGGPWHVAAAVAGPARARMRVDLLGPDPPGQPGPGRHHARVLGQQPRCSRHHMRHAAPVHRPAHRLTPTPDRRPEMPPAHALATPSSGSFWGTVKKAFRLKATARSVLGRHRPATNSRYRSSGW